MKSSYVPFAVLTVLSSFATPICLSDESPDRPSADARRQLEIIYEHLLPALEHKNRTAMVSFYTDDAILRSPDGKKFTGKKEITEYFATALAPDVTNKFAVHMEEVERHGDIAFEAGDYSLTEERQGKSETNKGSYIIIWKHFSNGSWRIYREIAN